MMIANMSTTDLSLEYLDWPSYVRMLNPQTGVAHGGHSRGCPGLLCGRHPRAPLALQVTEA
eukprot:5123143-Pleurochrysis_carterae.AAC.1